MARVSPRVTAIPLGRPLPAASSNQPGRPVRTRPEPDGARARAVPIRSCSRWGLPCRRVAAGAVRSYRTLSPLPRRYATAGAVCFLLHFPWGCARRTLSGTAVRGARTFLPHHLSASVRAAVRPTDDLEMARRGCSGGVKPPTGTAPPSSSSLEGLVRSSNRVMPSTRAGRKWRWNAYHHLAGLL